ncbi:uncharacterized protein LOC130897498 [Diorhabda carinulata]|uniref:uncharacterized protein LOC130897498 n=1 Tax=Diorhabda carinulata TaxID=1163345 RepID=UPI0025A284D3|nr:uncharacterized protein LOC130897498 [Diorhabda carinulata]
MNICDTVVNKLPSYLHDLFVNQCEDAIRLVFLNKSDEDIRPTKNTNFILNETENSISLDITGNPLEVDLKGDDSFLPENFQAEIIQHWSENENNHFPLSIKEARNYLNSRSRHKTSNYVFVLCDGNNPLKTIVLAVRQVEKNIYTCTVDVLGCFAKNHENISLSSMEKSHLLLTGNNESNITYVVTFKYFIFGTFLQNIRNVYGTKYFGSICIETSVNKKCNLDNPSSLVDGTKVSVQVIAGHKNSLINFLWEDLVSVYDYLKYFITNKGDPNTVICQNPLPVEDIYKSVNEIIHTNLIKRELKVEFSLENIRMPNILDKLWSIVKNCEDLKTLRDVFHYFFEELAETESNLKLPEDNTSNIAAIINGILDGKLAVPTINYSEALKFLIEIGAGKLKSDYQTILKQFYVPAAKSISSKWSEFESKLLVEETHRKTRITHHLKDNKIAIEKCMAKLGYLSKLHIATDLIYLVKNNAFLPEATFDYICERVCKCYVATKDIIHEFKDLIEKPVCSFNISVNNFESNVVENKIPDFCSIRMRSQQDKLETQTVYLMSKYLIFPPNIYNNYDIDIDEKQTLYYTYKLQSRVVTL